MNKHSVTGLALTAASAAVFAASAGSSMMIPTKSTFKVDAIGTNVPHSMGSMMAADSVTGTITVNSATNQLCYVLDGHNLGKVTSSQLRVGALHATGPVVATLSSAQVNAMSMHATCVRITHMAAVAILETPKHYYVNFATAKHPSGAVRAQL